LSESELTPLIAISSAAAATARAHLALARVLWCWIEQWIDGSVAPERAGCGREPGAGLGIESGVKLSATRA